MKVTAAYLTRKERALLVDRRLRDQTNRQIALIIRQQQTIEWLETMLMYQHLSQETRRGR